MLIRCTVKIPQQRLCRLAGWPVRAVSPKSTYQLRARAAALQLDWPLDIGYWCRTCSRRFWRVARVSVT